MLNFFRSIFDINPVLLPHVFLFTLLSCLQNAVALDPLTTLALPYPLSTLVAFNQNLLGNNILPVAAVAYEEYAVISKTSPQNQTVFALCLVPIARNEASSACK